MGSLYYRAVSSFTAKPEAGEVVVVWINENLPAARICFKHSLQDSDTLPDMHREKAYFHLNVIFIKLLLWVSRHGIVCQATCKRRQVKRGKGRLYATETHSMAFMFSQAGDDFIFRLNKISDFFVGFPLYYSAWFQCVHLCALAAGLGL